MKKYEIQMFIELKDYFRGPLSWHSGISNLDNGYGYDIWLIYKYPKIFAGNIGLYECTGYQGNRSNFETKRSISGADLDTCVDKERP